MKSVIFASMLFNDGVSDKDILFDPSLKKNQRFYGQGLSTPRIWVMTDKEFKIEEEVEKCMYM